MFPSSPRLSTLMVNVYRVVVDAFPWVKPHSERVAIYKPTVGKPFARMFKMATCRWGKVFGAISFFFLLKYLYSQKGQNHIGHNTAVAAIQMWCKCWQSNKKISSH